MVKNATDTFLGIDYTLKLTAKESVTKAINKNPELLQAVVAKALSPKIDTIYTDSEKNTVSTKRFSLSNNNRHYSVSVEKTTTQTGFLTIDIRITRTKP